MASTGPIQPSALQSVAIDQPLSAPPAPSLSPAPSVAPLAPLPKPKSIAAQGLLAAFKTVDADGDGSITQSELARAIVNPAIKGTQADAVAGFKIAFALSRPELAHDQASGIQRTLRQMFTTVGLGPQWHMTQDDLVALDASASDTMKAVDWWTARARAEREAHRATALFTNSLPSPSGVHEGPGMLDCFFTAAIVGLAQLRPQDLLKTVQRKANGDVDVHLGSDIAVTVSAPTDGELGYMGGSNDGIWYTALEKAYGNYRNEKSSLRGREPLPADAAGRIAYASSGIEAVTGHSAMTYLFSLNGVAALRNVVASAMNDKRIVVAGTTEGNDRIVAHHAYTVMSYDAKTDIITIRNAWGNNDGKSGPGVYAGGTVVMPFADFCKELDSIAVETPDTAVIRMQVGATTINW